MKIVQLGKYYPPYYGGVEIVTEQSAKALAARHDVTVICHNDANLRLVEDRDGIGVIRCATQMTLFRQPVSLDMGRELRRCRPDLIHFHAPNFWGAAMVRLFCPGTPLVITHHADVQGRRLLKTVLMPLYRSLLTRARRVFVSSLANARISVDLPPRLASLEEIPFGLDPRRFEIAEGERAALMEARRGAHGERTVFGFLGRLVWYKGLPVLLEALAKTSDADLVIAGHGPLRERLEADVVRRGLGDRVTFLGEVSDEEKLRLLHMIDVLVLPSTDITEAFGVVQIEAQLCGKPCITTDLPTGVSDVTVHDVTGIVVKAGDPDSLAHAISRLAASAALRKQFGAQALRRGLDVYSEQRYQEQLAAAVNKVLPQR